MTPGTKKDAEMSGGPRRHRDPEPWEVDILALISEQTTIPMDLLAQFLKISRERTVRLMEEFAGYRWVRIEKHLVSDEPWVWLRRAGVRRAGTGFAYAVPMIQQLMHHRALCVIRLHLESLHPDGTWVCERALADRKPKKYTRHLPDAVFEVHSEEGKLERWAVEGELSPKSIAGYRRIVASRCKRYDRLLYFCTPFVKTFLNRVPGLAKNPRVEARVFFKNKREVDKFQWIRSSSSGPNEVSASGHAEPWEVEILQLICEQLAIPVDQLARFLECEHDAAQRIADHLDGSGFVCQAHGPVDEPAWLWVTKAGARLAGGNLKYNAPSLLGVEKLRMQNEVRLYVAERDWDVRWWSVRMLRHKTKSRDVPLAIAEIGEEQQAVELEYRRRATYSLAAKYERRCHQFPDAVVAFCSGRRAKVLERLKEEHGWHNLEVIAFDKLNRRPSRRGKRKRPPTMYEIDAAELPGEALQVIQEAERLQSPPQVKSVARFRGAGVPRWRVVTVSRAWRVAKTPFGWFVRPCTGVEYRIEPREARDSPVSPEGATPYRLDKPARKLQRPLVTVPTNSLPEEARDAIRKAAGLKSTPKVKAVEKRQGGGFPRWRVATDAGTWRVTNAPQHGWIARPATDSEDKPALEPMTRWPQDPPGVMTAMDPWEVPGKALEVIQEVAGLPLPPNVVAASERRGRGTKRWRIETDAETWRVTHGSHGWTASLSE